MLDIHEVLLMICLAVVLEGARQTGLATVKFVQETNYKKFRCFKASQTI